MTGPSLMWTMSDNSANTAASLVPNGEALPIEVQLESGENPAEALQLSLDSVTLQTERPVSPPAKSGAKLTLHLRLSSNESPLKLEGVVEKQSGDQLRLRFDGLRVEARWALYRLLTLMTAPEAANDAWPALPQVRRAADDMSAAIDVDPPRQGMHRQARAMLEYFLEAKGITSGIDSNKLDEALNRAAESGQRQRQCDVAFAAPAVAEREATMLFEFSIAAADPSRLDSQERARKERTGDLTLNLVRRGDLLAHQQPRRKAQAGTSLEGKPIEPPSVEKAALKSVKRGDNVELDDSGKIRCATSCGYADLVAGTLSVLSPITISEDRMRVLLTVHPPDGARPGLTRTDVDQLLEDAGVICGIDAQAIDHALQSVQAGRKVLRDVEIARGRPAQPGDDAQLNFKLNLGVSVGDEKPDGHIDFRERGYVKNIRQGTVLCERQPLTPGTPGSDVLGQPISPEPGKEIEFVAGQNVKLQGDQFVATANGVFVLWGNTLNVVDVIIIDGSVNARSGHIRTDDAAVQVSGSVESGYSVEAHGLIAVGDMVADAHLKTAGNVEVAGGVVHQGSGLIQAGGSVTAHFANNAVIRAGGNITLEVSAIGCQLRAGERVILTKGKGSLIGGITHAAKGVEVLELGAESGVPTEVCVGGIDEEAEKWTRKLEVQLSILARKVGERTLESLRPEEKPKFARLITEREQLSGELKAFKEKLAREVSSDRDACIIVRGTVHAGVTVSIGGVHHKFVTNRSSCRIFLGESGKIEIEPLGHHK